MSTGWLDYSYIGNDILSGIQDGNNKIFTLSDGIVDVDTLIITNNSLTLTNTEDYSVSGSTYQVITFTVAPQSDDKIRAFYFYGSYVLNGFVSELAVGTKDNVNKNFTISYVPSPVDSLRLFLNGLLLNPDYTVSNTNIILLNAPDPTDILSAMYRTEISAGAEYHNPIFCDAKVDSNYINHINLGFISGDSIYYKFNTLDFEGNTINYNISNISSIPGNLIIDSNTGWLTGVVDKDLSKVTPYYFDVMAYKKVAERYQTSANCSLTILNSVNDNISWNGNSFVGNLIPDVPSTLFVTANVISSVNINPIEQALANCSMKLISANVINGGNAFSGSNLGPFTIIGGQCLNNAQFYINSLSSTGRIQSVIINTSIDQQYTELPGLTFLFENTSEDANSLNAILGLNFGVDTVNIIDGGKFYDTATVGFSEAGQTNSAIATATIYNNSISSCIVQETGNNYQSVPDVIINGKNTIIPVNPIKYELTGGNLPFGCKLLSNGLIAGLPTTQNYPQKNFEFTVTASIGRNRNISNSEPGFVDNNIITTDFQTLISSEKKFNINLINNATNEPRTNLSLEFLLGDNDIETLFSPLYDETIIPNPIIYRQGDFNFGIARHVRMLLAYGISPETAENIQESLSKYFHNKRYIFTELKWARSTTNNYEVIYIEPIDEFTNLNYETFSGVVKSGNDIVYPATLPNMISQLHNNLNNFDYNYLPSWMTDYQDDGNILNFVPAIPLVYVKPGNAKRIIYYLTQAYGSNLESIDAQTDRLLWNKGIQKNWNVSPVIIANSSNISNIVISANSSFTINTSIPVTYAPNLYPRTYSFQGNVEVTISGNLSEIINNINFYEIDGIIAKSSNNTLVIENSYGCPFILYDGTNTPLNVLGINVSIANTMIDAGWSIPYENDEFLYDDEDAQYFEFSEQSTLNSNILHG